MPLANNIFVRVTDQTGFDFCDDTSSPASFPHRGYKYGLQNCLGFNPLFVAKAKARQRRIPVSLVNEWFARM
jgi:hypothetical protein